MMKYASNIKDIVIIILLLWVGYSKAVEETKTKVVIKEVTKVVELPIYNTVSKVVRLNGSDTVIYLTKYDTISQTTVRLDSVYVYKNTKLFRDTINLDSSGVVYGSHMYRNNELRSKYKPMLINRTRTITNTVFKTPPIELYGNINTNGSIGVSLNGLKLQKQTLQVGYNYNPFINQHTATAGLRLFHF